jgi:hypothetical protein
MDDTEAVPWEFLKTFVKEKKKAFNVRQNSLRICTHDDSFHPGHLLATRQRVILQLLRSPGEASMTRSGNPAIFVESSLA